MDLKETAELDAVAAGWSPSTLVLAFQVPKMIDPDRTKREEWEGNKFRHSLLLLSWIHVGKIVGKASSSTVSTFPIYACLELSCRLLSKLDIIFNIGS
jgi:hypothetical protein